MTVAFCVIFSATFKHRYKVRQIKRYFFKYKSVTENTNVKPTVIVITITACWIITRYEYRYNIGDT